MDCLYNRLKQTICTAISNSADVFVYPTFLWKTQSPAVFLINSGITKFYVRVHTHGHALAEICVYP